MSESDISSSEEIVIPNYKLPVRDRNIRAEYELLKQQKQGYITMDYFFQDIAEQFTQDPRSLINFYEEGLDYPVRDEFTRRIIRNLAHYLIHVLEEPSKWFCARVFRISMRYGVEPTWLLFGGSISTDSNFVIETLHLSIHVGLRHDAIEMYLSPHEMRTLLSTTDCEIPDAIRKCKRNIKTIECTIRFMCMIERDTTPGLDGRKVDAKTKLI